MSDTPVIDRVRLRALAEQASEAPWGMFRAEDVYVEQSDTGAVICNVYKEGDEDAEQGDRDAEFIATARNAILSLLDAADERDRLAARVQTMEYALKMIERDEDGQCVCCGFTDPDNPQAPAHHELCEVAAALKGSKT